MNVSQSAFVNQTLFSTSTFTVIKRELPIIKHCSLMYLSFRGPALAAAGPWIGQEESERIRHVVQIS
jgi:hypothetical protein